MRNGLFTSRLTAMFGPLDDYDDDHMAKTVRFSVLVDEKRNFDVPMLAKLQDLFGTERILLSMKADDRYADQGDGMVLITFTAAAVDFSLPLSRGIEGFIG